MTSISRREIGSTGLSVTTLGFGGAPIGNLYQSISDDQADSTIQAALNAGIRLFDTAPLYGYGLSEHRVGRALRNVGRDRFVLSTKVGRLLTPADPQHFDAGQFPGCLPFKGTYDYSYDGVMRSIEDSLQRLGLHRIDIALIHDVDVWTHKTQEETDRRFREVMNGGYMALDELRRAGAISAIGAGVNEWEACQRFAEAGDFDCFLLAGRYTLLEQEALNTFLPLCEQRRISVIIGGPFNTGILATGAVAKAYYNYQPAPGTVLERVARIENICEQYMVPLPAAALQFPLHHPCVATVIPGARSVAEIKRAAALLETDIPVAFWSEMKATDLLRPDAPTP